MQEGKVQGTMWRKLATARKRAVRALRKYWSALTNGVGDTSDNPECAEDGCSPAELEPSQEDGDEEGRQRLESVLAGG